jgi:alkaline phosphatase
VILGGGEDRRLPADDPGAFPDAPAKDPAEKTSSDKGNLIDRARELGYRYVNSAEGLRQARGSKLLGLFANEEMFEQNEEGKGDIYEPVVPLATMTARRSTCCPATTTASSCGSRRKASTSSRTTTTRRR